MGFAQIPPNLAGKNAGGPKFLWVFTGYGFRPVSYYTGLTVQTATAQNKFIAISVAHCQTLQAGNRLVHWLQRRCARG